MMTPTEQYELASTILNTVVGLRFATLAEAEKRVAFPAEYVKGFKARFEEAFALRESLPSLDVIAIEGIIRDLGEEVRSAGVSSQAVLQGDPPQIRQ